MLTYSIGVSVDGFVADRDGGFGWGVPDDEQFAYHLEDVRSVGVHLLGRRLYEAMLPWETDPAMRATPAFAEFADVWTALPKVVFTRTLTAVQGNARLATAPLADEVAAALSATDQDVAVGGPTLAGQAFALGLVDEVRFVRSPVVLGGGLPALPPVTAQVDLDRVETRTFAGRNVLERYAVRR